MKFLFTFIVSLLPLISLAQLWEPLGEGLDGRVIGMAIDPNTGYLYAGGAFSHSDSVPMPHVAYWDGNQWNAMNVGLNGTVNDLEFYNGELYATGNFTSSGINNVRRIAKWNGNEWVNVGGGLNGEGYDLYQLNGKLYVGGAFQQAGQTACNSIARWDGTNWSSLDNSIQQDPDTKVRSITSYNGKIVIAGRFLIGGGAIQHIAILDDNNTWQSLGGEAGGYLFSVNELNGNLYVTGGFSVIDSVLIGRNILKWNHNDGWSAIDGPITRIASIFCQVNAYNNVIFGGERYSLGDSIGDSLVLYNAIANFHSVTGDWNRVSNGINKWVECLLFHDNVLYAGGRFTSAGGTTYANNIAKIDATALDIEAYKANSEFKVYIYPNPTNSLFHIDAKEPIESLHIYNSYGQLILYEQVNRPINRNIDLSGHPSGIYFIKIKTENSEFSSKIIKQ